MVLPTGLPNPETSNGIPIRGIKILARMDHTTVKVRTLVREMVVPLALPITIIPDRREELRINGITGILTRIARAPVRMVHTTVRLKLLVRATAAP
jgi:hypothetical protein